MVIIYEKTLGKPLLVKLKSVNMKMNKFKRRGEEFYHAKAGINVAQINIVLSYFVVFEPVQ